MVNDSFRLVLDLKQFRCGEKNERPYAVISWRETENSWSSFQLFVVQDSNSANGWPRICLRRANFFSLCCLGLVGLRQSKQTPQKSSKEYAEVVSAFYIGPGGAPGGRRRSRGKQTCAGHAAGAGRTRRLGELGSAGFRQRKLDVAAQRYDRARDLPPRTIKFIICWDSGKHARQFRRTRSPTGARPWKLIRGNYRAAYQLAQEVERQGGRGQRRGISTLIQNILKAQPDNLAALLDLARVAAKRGDAATLKSALAQISSQSSQVARRSAAAAYGFAGGGSRSDAHAAATRTTFLRNTLMRVPEFRESLAVLKAPPAKKRNRSRIFCDCSRRLSFRRHAEHRHAFSPKPVANGDAGVPGPGNGLAIPLGSAGPPVRVGRMAAKCIFPLAHVSVSRRACRVAPLPEGILPIDFNYDFNTDLVLAGAAVCV